MKHIYGPVASRRLGLSLGVDIVPYKTCSFDCIYCQLGRATNKIIERKEYFPKEEILSDINEAIESKDINVRGGKCVPVEYITFSGSGEPTLNSGIGWLIREIKKITQVPVAVLTNGSTLYDKQVREDLMSADLVVPSLDAGNDEIFEKVNRPHPSINIDKIVTGLKAFCKEYKGKIWLEIMLVKNVNDSLENVELLKSRLKEIEPVKVQLNTVIRPPAEYFAHPLSVEELENIKESIGDNCEVIAGFNRNT